jgi:hypothetical protein
MGLGWSCIDKSWGIVAGGRQAAARQRDIRRRTNFSSRIHASSPGHEYEKDNWRRNSRRRRRQSLSASAIDGVEARVNLHEAVADGCEFASARVRQRFDETVDVGEAFLDSLFHSIEAVGSCSRTRSITLLN